MLFCCCCCCWCFFSASTRERRAPAFYAPLLSSSSFVIYSFRSSCLLFFCCGSRSLSTRRVRLLPKGRRPLAGSAHGRFEAKGNPKRTERNRIKKRFHRLFFLCVHLVWSGFIGSHLVFKWALVVTFTEPLLSSMCWGLFLVFCFR